MTVVVHSGLFYYKQRHGDKTTPCRLNDAISAINALVAKKEGIE